MDLPTRRTLVLGALFRAIGTLWDLGFASLSGATGGWMAHQPPVATARPRIEGIAHPDVAAWAAATGSRPSRGPASMDRPPPVDDGGR